MLYQEEPGLLRVPSSLIPLLSFVSFVFLYDIEAATGFVSGNQLRQISGDGTEKRSKRSAYPV